MGVWEVVKKWAREGLGGLKMVKNSEKRGVFGVKRGFLGYFQWR